MYLEKSALRFVFSIFLVLFSFVFSSAGFGHECGSPAAIEELVKSYSSGAISRQNALNQGAQQTYCLSEMLRKRGIENEVAVGEQTYILISPKMTSSLGYFSAELQDKYSASVSFDFRYFIEHPFSVGTYVRDIRRMILGASQLLFFSQEDPLVLHELIHVKSWHRALSGERHYFQGVFFGPSMKPDELWLDEILAYGNDIAWTLKKFKRWLSSGTADSENPRLKEVLADCLSDRGSSTAMTPTETFWRTLCRKSVIRGWYIDPALSVVRNYRVDGNPTIEKYSGLLWNSLRWGEHFGLWPTPFGSAYGKFVSNLTKTLESSANMNREFQNKMWMIAESAGWKDGILNLRVTCESELKQLLGDSEALESCD